MEEKDFNEQVVDMVALASKRNLQKISEWFSKFEKDGYFCFMCGLTIVEKEKAHLMIEEEPTIKMEEGKAVVSRAFLMMCDDCFDESQIKGEWNIDNWSNELIKDRQIKEIKKYESNYSIPFPLTKKGIEELSITMEAGKNFLLDKRFKKEDEIEEEKESKGD